MPSKAYSDRLYRLQRLLWGDPSMSKRRLCWQGYPLSRSLENQCSFGELASWKSQSPHLSCSCWGLSTRFISILRHCGRMESCQGAKSTAGSSQSTRASLGVHTSCQPSCAQRYWTSVAQSNARQNLQVKSPPFSSGWCWDWRSARRSPLASELLHLG